MKLNCNKYFNNAFCLGERKIVESLEVGAKQYGGATKINDLVFSNYKEVSQFDIKNKNTLGIIVPSTIEVNKHIDNTQFVEKIVDTLEYFGNKCRIVPTLGSWCCSDGEVVVEKGSLVLFEVDNLDFDIRLVVELSRQLKKDMQQEGISILFNDSLAII